MPVNRTYECAKCTERWTMRHENSDDYCKRCPHCGAKANWSPQPLTIGANRGRAAKLAERIMEKEYGLTDFNGGAREGEVAAKGLAPQTTVQKEAMIRQIAETTRELSTASISPEMQASVKDATQLFKADNGQIAAAAANPVLPRNIDTSAMMAMAKNGSQEGRALNKGRSPMEMLHGGLKSGKIDPVRAGIMGRVPFK